MGRLVRIGFIGCGSHAIQNLYPALRLGVNGSPALREPNDQSPSDRFDFRTLHGYTGEVRHFIECVRDGTVGTPNIDDGIAHLKLEQAAKRSAQLGRPVALAEIT